jgi:hypothetical protein
MDAGLVSESLERVSNEWENTHAKAIAGEVNSWFLDVEVRYCIALLRIQHRAIVRPGA